MRLNLRLMAAIALSLAGCGEGPGQGPDTSGLCEAEPFSPSSERLLVLNGKLGSKAANYTLNERGQDGHWMGSEILVYDPSAPGEIRPLGRLDFGPDSEDFDKEQTVARDIAWSPAHGLWGIFTDTGYNDEWYLGHIDVPDLRGESQRLVVTLWAFRSTDSAVYGRDEITGMAFDGDRILLGTPAVGAFPGAVIEVRGPFPPSHEDPSDPYYLDGDRCEVLFDIEGNLGVGGDLATLGGQVLASLLPGNDPSLHRLARLGDGTEVIGSGTRLDATDWVTGLGAVQGRLLAISLEGKVHEVDLETGAFSCFDDLDAALPTDDLGQSTRRLRGAASVTLP